MNQLQQLSVACDFQGFLVCQMPRDIMEVELKIRTEKGKGPGRLQATTGFIAGGDYPATRNEMSTKAQLTQVLLLILVKGWSILLKHL